MPGARVPLFASDPVNLIFKRGPVKIGPAAPAVQAPAPGLDVNEQLKQLKPQEPYQGKYTSLIPPEITFFENTIFDFAPKPWTSTPSLEQGEPQQAGFFSFSVKALGKKAVEQFSPDTPEKRFAANLALFATGETLRQYGALRESVATWYFIEIPGATITTHTRGPIEPSIKVVYNPKTGQFAYLYAGKFLSPEAATFQPVQSQLPPTQLPIREYIEQPLKLRQIVAGRIGTGLQIVAPALLLGGPETVPEAFLGITLSALEGARAGGAVGAVATGGLYYLKTILKAALTPAGGVPLPAEPYALAVIARGQANTVRLEPLEPEVEAALRDFLNNLNIHTDAVQGDP